MTLSRLFIFAATFLLFIGLFPSKIFSQGEFFSSDSTNEELAEDHADSTKTSDLSSTVEDIADPSDQEYSRNPVVILNRAKIRVNNIILTEREFSIFFALRKLSPALSKIDNYQDAIEEWTQILGLEAFAKANNFHNLLPNRNEMDNRIRFFTENLQVQTLAQAVAKIDSSGDLKAADVRRFFYYQILREKGFVFALQQDFMNKIFTPREDEILLLYKQILASNPTVFKTPTQLYIRNIAIVEPANEAQKQRLIQQLKTLKQRIDHLTNFQDKQRQFIAAIRRYSSSHLRNTEVIGPLDEDLINQDFPEYKNLFNLKTGGISSVINRDGFIRLVFVDSKEEGTMKLADNPDIRQRLTGIIYNTKGESLFQDFMKNNLSTLDVQVIGGTNE